jgi:hypothetical protein
LADVSGDFEMLSMSIEAVAEDEKKEESEEMVDHLAEAVTAAEVMACESPSPSPSKKKAKNYLKERKKATKECDNDQAYWMNKDGRNVFVETEGLREALLEQSKKQFGIQADNGLRWTIKTREGYRKKEGEHREIKQ